MFHEPETDMLLFFKIKRIDTIKKRKTQIIIQVLTVPPEPLVWKVCYRIQKPHVL